MLLLKPTLCRVLNFRKTRNVLFWIFGILFGFFAGNKVPYSVVSLVRVSLPGSVSIVWALLLSLFPYLFCYLLRRFSLMGLLPFLLFGKAFSYTFSLCVVFCAFGSAGWLICVLCFFADFLSVFVLLRFLLDCTAWAGKRYVQNLIASIALTVFFELSNHLFVLPFWEALI